MPHLTILEEHGFFTKWSGTITVAELIQMQEQAHADPRFDSIHYSIHDFSECNALVFDQSGIEYMAAIDAAASKSNDQIKIAIVAANTALAKGISSYQSTGLSPFPLRLFSSLDEARTWVIQGGHALVWPP
jgi:hypothetical protein